MLCLGLLTVLILMTLKAATLERIEPKFGALYENLRVEHTSFARIYPVWFMLKRIAFVAMVFNFEYTHGMVVFMLYMYLFEMSCVLAYQPFHNLGDMKLEVFNQAAAYVFLVVLQIFNQKHMEDFSAEDLKIEAGEEIVESELFISPQ